MSELSRRSILKAGVIGMASTAAAAHAAQGSKSADQGDASNTFAVIVLGAGIAGAVAAVQARMDGASVALLEKMDRPATRSARSAAPSGCCAALCAEQGAAARSAAPRMAASRRLERVMTFENSEESIFCNAKIEASLASYRADFASSQASAKTRPVVPAGADRSLRPS
ncbi:MAG TPA: hypothetical protein DCZ56_02860 [Sutterella sp.]|nr:hypothetical protein [Sutterella sp.]